LLPLRLQAQTSFIGINNQSDRPISDLEAVMAKKSKKKAKKM
jgi:hypothetical protein